MKINKLMISLVVLGLLGCNKRPEFGTPTPADFSYFGIALSAKFPNDKNAIVFENTTGFVSRWEFEGGNKSISVKNKDTVYFAKAGTYSVTLTSGSKGGTAKVTKQIVIDKDSEFKADFEITAVDGFRFKFKNTSPLIESSKWVYSNGEVQDSLSGSVYLPWVGTYNITLNNELVKGVFLPVTKQVVVASDDANNPALTDPMFTKLTGGVNDLDGKTWVVCTTAGVTPQVDIGSGGVGPYDPKEMKTTYWNYAASNGGYGGAFINGCAANEYTFILRDFQFKPLNNKVTVHYDWAFLDFGKPFVQYNDLALEDPNVKPAPFVLKNEGIGITGYTLKFGNGSYLAYYDGANRQNYEICKFSANADSVWIRHKYSDYTNGDKTKNPDAISDPSKDANQRVMLFKLKQ